LSVEGVEILETSEIIVGYRQNYSFVLRGEIDMFKVIKYNGCIMQVFATRCSVEITDGEPVKYIEFLLYDNYNKWHYDDASCYEPLEKDY
jgi:hypothetical protein